MSRLQECQKRNDALIDALNNVGQDGNIIDQLIKENEELKKRSTELETAYKNNLGILDWLEKRDGKRYGILTDDQLPKGHVSPPTITMEAHQELVQGAIVQTVQITANEMHKSMARSLSIDAPIYAAIRTIDSTTKSIFRALLFTDSPTWKSGLKKLQDQLNSSVTELQSAIRLAKDKWGEIGGEAKENAIKTWDEVDNQIVAMAADFNNAIVEAIGGNDGGAALNTMAQTIDPKMFESLLDQINEGYSELIASERRLSRAAVWIGWYCNNFEQEAVSTNVEKMWKSALAKLRIKQGKHQPDEQAAWLFFQERKPLELTGEQLRFFEQEISRFKREMRSYHPISKVTTKPRQEGEN